MLVAADPPWGAGRIGRVDRSPTGRPLSRSSAGVVTWNLSPHPVPLRSPGSRAEDRTMRRESQANFLHWARIFQTAAHLRASSSGPCTPRVSRTPAAPGQRHDDAEATHNRHLPYAGRSPAMHPRSDRPSARPRCRERRRGDTRRRSERRHAASALAEQRPSGGGPTRLPCVRHDAPTRSGRALYSLFALMGVGGRRRTEPVGVASSGAASASRAMQGRTERPDGPVRL